MRSQDQAFPIKKITGNITIDFRAGAVDQQYFPLKIWRQMANQILHGEECYTYGDPFGEPRLKEQLVGYLLQARGVHVDAEDIFIGSSTQQLLIYLGFLLKEDFDNIILEDPVIMERVKPLNYITSRYSHYLFWKTAHSFST